MKRMLLFGLAAVVTGFLGCEKEKSFEIPNNPSEGSLQSEASGDCLPKTVNGVYEAGVSLVPTTNSISIEVDVTKAGNYLITSDTVNGYYFRATGTFTSTGSNTVTLRGNGTAFAAGVNNFVISYNGTVCDVQVTVLPAGATGPAVFALTSSGTPAVCGTPVISGSFIKDVAINPLTNTVTLQVNTTTAGTYSVTTVLTGGMTFAGTGSLTTGPGTIVLKGSGTPTTVGTTTISVTAGTSTCTFDIPVTAGAVFSIDCATAQVNGSYVALTPLTAANTVILPITVTTPGAYLIATTAVNGMTFTGSGNVTAATTTITLTGNGTPAAAAAPSNINVSFGASTCSFGVTVTAPAGPATGWKFTEGATTYQGTFDFGSFSTIGGIAHYGFVGFNADRIFELAIGDISASITAGEIYGSGATCACNNVVFKLNGSTGTPTYYSADPSTAGTTFKVTVTSHNTTTKTISGTFSGTVKDGAGVTKTITGGEFTGTYN